MSSNTIMILIKMNQILKRLENINTFLELMNYDTVNTKPYSLHKFIIFITEFYYHRQFENFKCIFLVPQKNGKQHGITR